MPAPEQMFTPAPDALITPIDAQPTTPASGSVCAQPYDGDLRQRQPGDLIRFEEISDRDDPAFPPEARAWRVQYVSTGRDNNERTLICGIVVAPAAPSRRSILDENGTRTGRVVAWCHGTLGVVPRCQPSETPAGLLWGATPWGIGAVAWGSEAAGDRHAGRPEEGILAGMIANGWIVTATDYFVDRSGGEALHPYVLGKIEAANTIDNIRAAHQLLGQVYAGYSLDAYEVVTWGHSQGGHAALWSGQLLESYAAATAPDGPALSLAGVAMAAPGSTFITRPEVQTDTEAGYGLFDWLAHAELQATGLPEPTPLAPFFFSYVFGAWAAYAAGDLPDSAAMPAFPKTGPLELTALVRLEALATVSEMTGLCWADGEAVTELVAPYRSTPFLTQAVSEGPVINGLQHGAFDEMCAGDPAPELAAWCEWLRYNLPGPLGTSDLDKLPRRGDGLAPVAIFVGSNDGIVHCVAPAGTEGAIPPATDCMAVALYDALEAEFCPDGAAAGHLTLSVWQPEDGITAADHSDICGLAAAAGTDDPRFTGSPLERFITAAFGGTLTSGCSARVVNGPD